MGLAGLELELEVDLGGIFFTKLLVAAAEGNGSSIYVVVTSVTFWPLTILVLDFRTVLTIKPGLGTGLVTVMLGRPEVAVSTTVVVTVCFDGEGEATASFLDAAVGLKNDLRVDGVLTVMVDDKSLLFSIFCSFG